MIKNFWDKIKKFLNPFLLIPIVFILGVIYGLTKWEPILWIFFIAAIPVVIGGIVGIIYVWIIKPIKWIIDKIKNKK